MNKTTTVLLVSAAVVVGIVITGFAAVMFTPAGYMLFGTSPMWGHTTCDHGMTGHHGTMGGSDWRGCPNNGHDVSKSGYGMMHRRGMMGGPGMMHGCCMMGGPGMMGGHGMIGEHKG